LHLSKYSNIFFCNLQQVSSTGQVHLNEDRERTPEEERESNSDVDQSSKSGDERPDVDSSSNSVSHQSVSAV